MPAKNPAKQKRKRCENCNKLFEPKKLWAKFCKDECRKEFHRYGSSYGPLKTGLHKAIDKQCAALIKKHRAEVVELAEEVATTLEDHLRCIQDLDSEAKRLAVEVAELRAKVDTDRGQCNHEWMPGTIIAGKGVVEVACWKCHARKPSA